MDASGIGDKTPQAIQVACTLALEAREEALLESLSPAMPTAVEEMVDFRERKNAKEDRKERGAIYYSAKQGAPRQHRQLFVAGSMSTHPPAIPKGGENSALALWPSPEEEKMNYVEAATAISSSGVDFLFLEMMKDLKHAPRAIAAARRCGLPIFLGISARLDGPEKK